MDAFQLIGSLSSMNSGGALPKIAVYSISHGTQGTTVSTNIGRHSIYIAQESYFSKAGAQNSGVWYTIIMPGNKITVSNVGSSRDNISLSAVSGTLTILTDAATFYTSQSNNGGFDGTIENLLIGVD